MKPNAASIRKARRLLGYSQTELAKQARVNLKTLKRVEKGRRVRAGTLRAIASALGVHVRRIRIPDTGGGDSVAECLDEAIRADGEADFSGAIAIAEALADQMDKEDRLRLEVIVRLASFYDHDGRWEDALVLLKSRVLGPEPQIPDGEESDGQLLWALYQYGLIQRVGAESLLAHTGGRMTERINRLLDSTERILTELAASKRRSMRISATHQLGVVMLIRSQLESAASSFTKCIAERARQRPQSPGIRLRRAYSFRRRAMTRAKMGRLQDARRDWRQAEALARQDSLRANRRLLREIRRDRMAWLTY